MTGAQKATLLDALNGADFFYSGLLSVRAEATVAVRGRIVRMPVHVALVLVSRLASGERPETVEASARWILKRIAHHRGHMIVRPGERWIYADTRLPVEADKTRACGHCRLDNRDDGHDACLGELPGVVNACCGHGISRDAWAVKEDGSRVSSVDALRFFEDCGVRVEANGDGTFTHTVATNA